MEICQGGVSSCDRPCSTWSVGAPFLTSNLLVVWMTTMDDKQKMWPVSERGAHLCFKDMSCINASGRREAPWSLLSVSPSISFPRPLSLCVSVCRSPLFSLSFTPSHSPNRGVSGVLSRSSFWDRCQLQTKDIKKQWEKNICKCKISNCWMLEGAFHVVSLHDDFGQKSRGLNTLSDLFLWRHSIREEGGSNLRKQRIDCWIIHAPSQGCDWTGFICMHQTCCLSVC